VVVLRGKMLGTIADHVKIIAYLYLPVLAVLLVLLIYWRNVFSGGIVLVKIRARAGFRLSNVEYLYLIPD